MPYFFVYIFIGFSFILAANDIQEASENNSEHNSENNSEHNSEHNKHAIIADGMFNILMRYGLVPRAQIEYIKIHSNKILNKYLNTAKVLFPNNENVKILSYLLDRTNYRTKSKVNSVSFPIPANDLPLSAQFRLAQFNELDIIYNLRKFFKEYEVYLKACWVAILISSKYNCDEIISCGDLADIINHVLPGHLPSWNVAYDEAKFLKIIDWRLFFE